MGELKRIVSEVGPRHQELLVALAVDVITAVFDGTLEDEHRHVLRVARALVVREACAAAIDEPRRLESLKRGEPTKAAAPT